MTSGLLLKTNDRIVFLGDSITEQRRNVARGVTVDQERIRLTLRAGSNMLLLKVS
ncbi:MAG: hypothetical protein WCI03_00970 [bacterium]|jgi:hypothetical protein